MTDKKRKLYQFSPEMREPLARLVARPEFAAFEKLAKIQEHNIMVESFSINSSDPQIAIKKGWYEGRLWELRKLIEIFGSLRKEEE